MGRLCYAKFVAVPNYAYLKLKMPGPRGVIMIFTNFRDAYECKREAVEQDDRTLHPEEARLNFEVKRRKSSGTTRCALSSPEHQTTPVTSSSISPTLLLLSASPAPPLPEKEPEEVRSRAIMAAKWKAIGLRSKASEVIKLGTVPSKS